MKFNKIIIVGGGSAGWMTAATFINQFPEKEIILIESKNYPTVGVGESTIGGINDWLSVLGISDKDFMPHCDASYKLSIRFEDFYKKGDGGFHYPFGNTYTENNRYGSNDWFYKKAANPSLHVKDYADCYYPQMALVNQNKIFKNHDNRLPGFHFVHDTAYHFDATKFGLWLRDHYCIPRGVKHIFDEIIDTKSDENGITELLGEQETYTADLYIDCTGFKSLLLEKTLEEPFESYAEMLPNNSAWATRIPYTNKQTELQSYTNCTAIENGWVWNIPLWSRIGTGYVYSDKYVNDEEALSQFKSYLIKNKNRTVDNIDEVEYRNIKMRIGIHERLFVKNTCAIGLSAGFIEPLESNGLFTVHTFLLQLMKVLKRDRENISQWDRDTFNHAAKTTFRTFAEFVGMHYALSHRDDTHYWQEIKNKIFDPTLSIENVKYINGFQQLITDRMVKREYWLSNGSSCIATGFNYFPLDMTDILSREGNPEYDMKLTKENILRLVSHLDHQKDQWAESVKNERSLYDYLKDMHEK